MQNASEAANDEVPDEEGIQIFDVVPTADGGEIPVPASSVDSHYYDFKPSGHMARGGFSAVGYMVVERDNSGAVRIVQRSADVGGGGGGGGRSGGGDYGGGGAHWLRLKPPFAPCDEECANELSLLESLFSWAPTLSPAACKAVSEFPGAVAGLLTALAVSGFAQLHLALRKSRARGRLARLPLMRGLLLLTATLPVRVCRSNGSVDRCIAARRRKQAARLVPTVNASGGHGNTTTMGGANGTAGSAGRATLGDARDDWRNAPLNGTAILDDGSGGDGGDGHWIEYDGYEDSRVFTCAARFTCSPATRTVRATGACASYGARGRRLRNAAPGGVVASQSTTRQTLSSTTTRRTGAPS